MAIKKIKFNREGFVSEEVVDKPMSRPPPEPPKKVRKKARAVRAQAKASPVKTTKIASEPEEVAEGISISGRDPDAKKASLVGKSVLDKDVIKFKCERCGSERVVEKKEAIIKCGLCGAVMKYQH